MDVADQHIYSACTIQTHTHTHHLDKLLDLCLEGRHVAALDPCVPPLRLGLTGLVSPIELRRRFRVGALVVGVLERGSIGELKVLAKHTTGHMVIVNY